MTNNNTSDSERRLLDTIARNSTYAQGINGEMIKYSVEIFFRWAKPGSILEIGPAEGHATHYLQAQHSDVEVLEGSHDFAIQLKNKFHDLTIHNFLIEEFTPRRSYTNIILSHVLEHVENPTSAMEAIAKWLEPGGTLFAAVPNALSFHRQIGVLAGDLGSEDELHDGDLSIGHRRVFSGLALRRLISGVGMEIRYFGGYFLKTLSNSQLETVINPNYIRAFMEAGERAPEFAADIYVVATKPNQ